MGQQQIGRAPPQLDDPHVRLVERGQGAADARCPRRVVGRPTDELRPHPGAARQVVHAPGAGERRHQEQPAASHRLVVEGLHGRLPLAPVRDRPGRGRATVHHRHSDRGVVGAELDLEERAAAVQRRVGGELGRGEQDVVDEVSPAPADQRIVDETSYGGHARRPRHQTHARSGAPGGAPSPQRCHIAIMRDVVDRVLLIPPWAFRGRLPCHPPRVTTCPAGQARRWSMVRDTNSRVAQTSTARRVTGTFADATGRTDEQLRWALTVAGAVAGLVGALRLLDYLDRLGLLGSRHPGRHA